MGSLDPDLVAQTGLQAQTQLGNGAGRVLTAAVEGVRLDDFEVSDGPAGAGAVGCDNGLVQTIVIKQHGMIPCAGAGGRATVDIGEIGAFELVGFDLIDEVCARGGGKRAAHETAGVFIQAVHRECGATGGAPAVKVLLQQIQRAVALAVAGGHGQQAGGFVDDGEIVVDEDDAQFFWQVQIACRNTGRGGAVSKFEALAGVGHLFLHTGEGGVIKAHAALLEPFFDAFARTVGKLRREPIQRAARLAVTGSRGGNWCRGTIFIGKT